jgi:hypothetical protein
MQECRCFLGLKVRAIDSAGLKVLFFIEGIGLYSISVENKKYSTIKQ